MLNLLTVMLSMHLLLQAVRHEASRDPDSSSPIISFEVTSNFWLIIPITVLAVWTNNTLSVPFPISLALSVATVFVTVSVAAHFLRGHFA